jgi:hypothetical protein
MQDDNVDVRLEIKVATFWRKQIGDLEYQRYLPADLFRWYMAMELAGPDDVRELFHRRQSGRPMTRVYGLVGTAPHPPANVVQVWLETHETQIYTSPYWYGLAVFTAIAFMFGVYMNGLQNLRPLNPFYLNPPQLNAVVASAPMPMPTGPNTPMPTSPTAPVSQLPVNPMVVVAMPVSTIPILPSTVGGTMRTNPLQSVPTSVPRPQYGLAGVPSAR